MMELFKCIIELPKFPIKKNNKAIFRNKATGRSFIASNSKAQSLMNILNTKLLQEKLRAGIDTIECDVNVSMQFYYPSKIFFCKKTQKRSKKIADIGNLYQAVEDGLQKVGIILNDNLIESHDHSGRFPIDGDIHKLRIVITKKEINYG